MTSLPRLLIGPDVGLTSHCSDSLSACAPSDFHNKIKQTLNNKFCLKNYSTFCTRTSRTISQSSEICYTSRLWQISLDWLLVYSLAVACMYLNVNTNMTNAEKWTSLLMQMIHQKIRYFRRLTIRTMFASCQHSHFYYIHTLKRSVVIFTQK